MEDKEFEEKYYSIQELKAYKKLSISKKLECIEEMNRFLNAFIPEKTKRIQEQLRKEGW